MTLRDLKTVPAGLPAPIFFAMRCNPSGVQFEPSFCPAPKREVEQRINWTMRYSFGVPALAGSDRLKAELRTFSKSETVWFATLTTSTKRVGTTPFLLQARKKFSSSVEWAKVFKFKIQSRRNFFFQREANK